MNTKNKQEIVLLDYFNKKVMIGDTIIWMPSTSKSYTTANVAKFGNSFGDDCVVTDTWDNRKVSRGFIIIARKDGTKLKGIV